MLEKRIQYVTTKKATMEKIISAKCPFSKGDRAEYDANCLGEYADIRKEEEGLLTVPEKTYIGRGK